MFHRVPSAILVSPLGEILQVEKFIMDVAFGEYYGQKDMHTILKNFRVFSNEIHWLLRGYFSGKCEFRARSAISKEKFVGVLL